MCDCSHGCRRDLVASGKHVASGSTTSPPACPPQGNAAAEAGAVAALQAEVERLKADLAARGGCIFCTGCLALAS